MARPSENDGANGASKTHLTVKSDRLLIKMLGFLQKISESYISYTISKSLYRIDPALGHRLTVYATKTQTGKFVLQMMCYK